MCSGVFIVKVAGDVLWDMTLCFTLGAFSSSVTSRWPGHLTSWAQTLWWDRNPKRLEDSCPSCHL